MLVRYTDFFFGRLYGLQQRIFDMYMGTSTTGRSTTSSDIFAIGGENWPYEGCNWPALTRALQDFDPKDSDVFVDLGSGKGKALLIAGLLPYRQVIGVEIDSDLAESARKNVDRARRRLRAGRVESVTASVLEWPVPDNTSVIFMYNPFFGKTFRDAMTRVLESYDRNPRDLHIVYGFPWEHDWLMETGRVVVEGVRAGTWPARRRWWESAEVIVTYHVVGVGESASSCPARPAAVAGKAMQRWSRPNGHRFEDHSAQSR